MTIQLTTIKLMSILRGLAYKLRGLVFDFKKPVGEVYEWDLYLSLSYSMFRP